MVCGRGLLSGCVLAERQFVQLFGQRESGLWLQPSCIALQIAKNVHAF